MKKYHGILGRYFLPWYTMVKSTTPKYHGTFLCGHCAMVENTGAWYTMVHGIPRYNMCHAIPCTMVYHGTFYHGKKVPA